MQHPLETRAGASSCPGLRALFYGLLCSLAFVDALALPLVGYDANGNQTSQRNAALAAPSIVAQPPDVLLQADGSARFHVVATSVGPLTYQWKKNGVNIAGATNDTLLVTGLSADSAEQGQYTVVVGNSAGSVTSAMAEIFRDTDSNGMADAKERQAFSGVSNRGPAEDYDGDGVSNFDEFAFGSRPAGFEYYLTNAGSMFLYGSSSTPTVSFIGKDLVFFAPQRTGPYSASGGVPGLSLFNPETGLLTFATNAVQTFATGEYLPLVVTTPSVRGLVSRTLKTELPEVCVLTPEFDASLAPPFGLEEVVAVSVGWLHGLALKSDGTVVAWRKDNYRGQTDGSGLTNVVAVEAGPEGGLALKSDGTVVAWGNNRGQAGPVPAGLTNVVAVSAGSLHNLALKSDGTVVAWGYAHEHDSDGLTDVPAGLTNVVAVSVGNEHNLALKSDGTVVAWGTQTNVPILTNLVAVSAGGAHNLALKSDGTVVAWGDNSRGLTNVPAGLTNVVAVSAGQDGSLALKSDGTVVAWGGIQVERRLHPMVALSSRYWRYPLGLADALSLEHGSKLIAPPCVLGEVGRALQVRVAAKGDGITYAATGLPSGLSINPQTGLISGTTTQIGMHNIVLKGSGEFGEVQKTMKLIILRASSPRILASGSSMQLVVGRSFSFQPTVNFPCTDYSATGLPPGLSINGITGLISGIPTTTGDYTVSVTAETHGGLAVGTFRLEVPEVYTFGPLSSQILSNLKPPVGLIDVVALSERGNLALKSDGTVVGWGSSANVPSGLANVVSVSEGAFRSLALKADGTVVEWDKNTGQLMASPPGLTNVVAIAAGGFSSALKADGTVVRWRSRSDVTPPGFVGYDFVPPGLTNVVAISAEDEGSLALKADGTVVGWGGGLRAKTTPRANQCGRHSCRRLQLGPEGRWDSGGVEKRIWTGNG